MIVKYRIICVHSPFQPPTYVIDDGLYGLPVSQQMATRKMEPLQESKARSNSKSYSSSRRGLLQPKAKELTYSYSSSSEEESTENDESSLQGSFAGSAVVT